MNGKVCIAVRTRCTRTHMQSCTLELCNVVLIFC